MLDTLDWNRLGKLSFAGRRSVHGQNPGLHPSNLRGGGVEFHEYRPYCPGDDAGQIDWKLYARTDRLYLRRSRSPVDLNAYILLDHTASMDFPNPSNPRNPRTLGRRKTSTPVSKLRYATNLAAATAYIILRQSDRVGLGLFADRVTDHLPPSRDSNQLQRILDRLGSVRAVRGHQVDGGGQEPADIGKSIREARGLMRRRGLVILISDLLDPADRFLQAMRTIRQARFDVVVFQVLSCVELELADLPATRLRLIDPETHDTLGVEIRHSKADYLRNIQAHLAVVREGCRRIGAGYHLFTTTDPLIDSLGAFLGNRHMPQTTSTG